MEESKLTTLINLSADFQKIMSAELLKLEEQYNIGEEKSEDDKVNILTADSDQLPVKYFIGPNGEGVLFIATTADLKFEDGTHVMQMNFNINDLKK